MQARVNAACVSAIDAISTASTSSDSISVEAVVEHRRATDLGGDLLGAGPVDVRDGRHGGSRDGVGELVGVVGPDGARADDPDANGHGRPPAAAAPGDRPTLRPQRREVLARPGGDRQRDVRVARVQVLLDDAEQLPVERRERRQHGRHVRSPSGGSTITPSRTAGANPSCSSRTRAADRRVDLLEVDVADPAPVVADDGQVVGAAVRDVPRVEAQVDRLGVRAVEEALDLRLRADVAVRVGVEHEHGAVRVGDVPAELGHPGRQRRPLVVGQGRAADEVALEVRVSLGQDHEVAGAERADGGHLRVAVGLRLRERVLALVERDEHRPAGEREAALRVLVADDAGVRRQVAVGSELGVPVARRLDLVEVARPGRLERVEARVPHAPRVRGGPEPQLRVLDAGASPGHQRFLRSSMMIATMMITPLTTCW